MPRVKSPPPALRAAAILALFVALFLGRPLLHGGWYLPADLANVTGAATNPAHPTDPENPLETDPYTQMDPWFHFDVQEIHSGRLPLWNPYDGLGAPQLANYQSAVYSPFSLPFYLLPFRWALLLAAGLRLWTLSFFTYLFLRRSRLSGAASMFGAVAFGWGGYNMLWLNWQHVGAAICLPAGAWATQVVLQAGSAPVRRRGLAALALAVGTAAVAGHPETLLWSMGGLALTILGLLLTHRGPWRSRFRIAVPLLLATGLGVALGAAQLLPFREYLLDSTTYAMRSGHGSGTGLDSHSLALLAFPDTLGNPSVPGLPNFLYLGDYNELNSDYVGLIAMGLAFVGLTLLFRRGPLRKVAAIGGVLSLIGFALIRIPAVSTAASDAPVLSLSRVNRSYDVWIFGVALLSALGIEVILGRLVTGWPLARVGKYSSRTRRRRPRRLASVAGVAAGGACAITVSIFGYDRLRRHEIAAVGAAAKVRTIDHLLHQHVGWILAWSGGAVLLVTLMIAAPHWLGGRKPLVAATVAVLVIAQFAVTGGMLRDYNPSVPASAVYQLNPDYSRAVALTGDEVSMHNQATSALPDSNLWWRSRQLTTYDAVGVRWYDALFRQVFGEQSMSFFDEGTPRCLAALRLFGVQWVWSRGGQPFTAGQHGSGDVNAAGKDVAKLPLRARIGDLSLYGVPGSTGRFSVVPNVQVAANETAALAEVSSCGFDSNMTAVALSTGLGSLRHPRATTPLAPVPAASQQVTVAAEDAEDLTLQVSAGAGGELVLRQTWFPGWQATVDGQSTAIDRVDVAFRGIALQPGAHTVTLHYRPPAVRNGLIISAAALVVVGGLALPPLTAFRLGVASARSRKRRRRRPPTGDGDAQTVV